MNPWHIPKLDDIALLQIPKTAFNAKESEILSLVCFRFPINSFLEFLFYDTYSEVDRYRSEQRNNIEGYCQLIIDTFLTAYEIIEFNRVLDGSGSEDVLGYGGETFGETVSKSTNNTTVDGAQRHLNIYAP